MKKCILLLAIVIFVSCSQNVKEKHYKQITKELIGLVQKDPLLEKMLTESINSAKKINPDKKTNPVQNLKEYYNFINKTVDLLPQDIISNPKKMVRENLKENICYFYFLIDQPLTELENQGYYNNTLQYYPPFSKWLSKYVKLWGSFLSSEASWSPKIYKEFYNDPSFGLQKGWYEPASNWKTFNQFFSRNLISPDVRPIASTEDPFVVVSPADSVPVGEWKLDRDSNIMVDGGLGIKFARFYSVKDLLGKDSKYKDSFEGGILTHTFLNINDYHHYHFAVPGIVKEKRIIQQNVAIEIEWNKKDKKYIPIDSTGWQFFQTRGYVIVDTQKYGLVALIPIGMANVDSVIFEDNVTVGSYHKKGDKLGYFLFGGSDFVMLFQKKADFHITAPIEKKYVSRPESDRAHKVFVYKHLLMGEQYGIIKGK